MTRLLACAVLATVLSAGCHHRPARPPGPTPSATVLATEICGNCVDDDANGRVDDEDPHCCPHVAALESGTVEVNGDQLTVNARFPPGALREPNPLLDDVGVLVRAGKKVLVCGTIGHQFWTKSAGTYRFRPRGTPATRGLPETFVRLLPTGAVAVRVTTVRANLAQLTDAAWSMTLRIGDGCGSGNAKLGASPPAE